VSLQVFVLGEFRVLRDGVPIERWPRPSTQRLLKLLALAPRQQMACEALAERLWPGEANPRTQQRLHHQVYLLNQALGRPGDSDKPAGIQHSMVRLSSKLAWWIDALAFELALEASMPSSADTQSLVDALALYRGPLLPDEPGDDELAAQRSYLEQRQLNGLYTLAARHAQGHDLLSACAALQRVLQLAPADEVAHRQLIEWYGRMGQLAQAEYQFTQCKQALSRAFAASPSDATLHAYRQALHSMQSKAVPAEPQFASTSPAVNAPIAAALRFTPPAPLLQLLGREALVADVKAAVLNGTWRLHTLVGTGGVGKTQLALRLAHELASSFRHGVCFVSLTEVRDNAVLDQIARALGVVEQPHKNLQASVLEFLADKHLLLVLDNFEHVLPSAELLAPLLTHSAALALLVTSRIRLNLAAEAVLEVPPLQADAGSHAAVQLFVRRAKAVQPHFALTAANTDDAVAIAQQLGGLPLALELAAARVPLYSLAALREQLALDHSSVVSGGGADRPQRHRSIDASLAWSHALLPPDQQQVLHRVAQFVEPFDLAQAQSLCAGLDSNLPLALQALIEAGFVKRDASSEHSVEPRFGLLALTQEFLSRCPRDASAASGDARAFVAHQLRLAQRLDGLIDQGQTTQALHGYNASRLSFFAALEAAKRLGDTMSMARLVRHLVRCWSRAGVFARAMPWVKHAAQQVKQLPCAEQGWLLLMVGYFLVDHGEPDEGHARAGEAITLAECSDDAVLEARAALLYSGTAAAIGTPEAGIAALMRTQAHAQRVGDADLLHKASVNLGVCHLQCGNLPAARAQWLACDERFQGQKTQARVSTLFNLALSSHYGGAVAEAMRLLDLANELERCAQPQHSRLLHIQLRRAWMHCCGRDADAAQAALNEAQDIVARASLANAHEAMDFLRGKIDAARGDVAGALRWLASAATQRSDRADPWDLLDSRLWLFHALWAQPHTRARAHSLLPTLQNDVRGWRQETPRVLEAVAIARCDEGQLDAAAQAWNQAQTLRANNSMPRFGCEQGSVALTLHVLRQGVLT
jgi:predicted ATPase/DNA-binding SARP family transcriptional activator